VKLECSRKDLVDAIALVAPAASSRSPQPLFQTIRLEAVENSLELMACDGEMWAERAILAAVEEPGAVCVQAKVLQELITLLPDGPVTLEKTSGAVFVRSGGSEWRLMALNADDFLTIPTINASSRFTLKMSEFRDAVDGVMYAVADDGGRAVLTGVQFNYDGQLLTLVATDTHRLAVNRIEKPGMGSNLTVVMSEKSLKTIKNLPVADEEEITIEFDDTRLSVDTGTARVVSQLLSGAYPNWERVVPNEFTRTWKLDRAELMENLKRTMILARDAANRVRFGGNGMQVIISARSDEKGEAKEEIPAIMENGDIEIAFNGRYLLEALSAMRSDSVVAQLTEASRPAIIRPNDESTERFCVIMPMTLN